MISLIFKQRKCIMVVRCMLKRKDPLMVCSTHESDFTFFTASFGPKIKGNHNAKTCL